MCSDAGMVPIAPPSTQQVTGSVARPIYGASARPARPLMAISVELLVNSNAWQAASKPTLRRVLPSLLSLYTVDTGPHGNERPSLSSGSALLRAGAFRNRSARGVRRRLDARRARRTGAQDP